MARILVEPHKIQEIYKSVHKIGIPATFDKFANYYFENFHKRKVCAETYRITQSNYKNHVLPHFGDGRCLPYPAINFVKILIKKEKS